MYIDDIIERVPCSPERVSAIAMRLSECVDIGCPEGQLTELCRYLLRENLELKSRIETLEHKINNHRFA